MNKRRSITNIMLLDHIQNKNTGNFRTKKLKMNNENKSIKKLATRCGKRKTETSFKLQHLINISLEKE